MLVPFLCTWLALAPNGHDLLVAQPARQRVVRFDIGARKMTGEIQLSWAPTGLTVTEGRILVTGNNQVTIFEPAVRNGITTIPAGRGAMSPVLSPDGKTLYVSNRFDGAVAVIDLKTRKTIATLPIGREPYAAALTPDGRWLYVATHLPEQPATAGHIAAKVCIIDTGRVKVDRCISLPDGSTSVLGIAISPDGEYAFVTHILARYTVHTTQLEQGWINTNALSIIEVRARKLRATVLLDDVDNGAANPWAVACGPDSKQVYVTHAGTHELSIIDFPALLRKIEDFGGDPSNQLSFLLGVRRRIQLGGKGPRAVVVAGDKVWVAEYFSSTLSSVSLGARPAVNIYKLGPEEPMTPARRGEMLFHDASLCFQHWQSCASCHPDARVDGLNWDLLNDGIGNPKNVRSLLNSYQTAPVMWTGIRPNAKACIRAGLLHILFTEPREAEVAAIEAYLRSLEPVPGPRRNAGAIERGRKLFFSRGVGCVGCHSRPLYTDNKLHELGTHGRFDFTMNQQGRRVPQTAFKTPSLIEVWRTAPYLHDGRYATLKEVVTVGNHADRHGKTSHLTEQQINDLVAFVRSL